MGYSGKFDVEVLALAKEAEEEKLITYEFVASLDRMVVSLDAPVVAMDMAHRRALGAADVMRHLWFGARSGRADLSTKSMLTLRSGYWRVYQTYDRIMREKLFVRWNDFPNWCEVADLDKESVPDSLEGWSLETYYEGHYEELLRDARCCAWWLREQRYETRSERRQLNPLFQAMINEIRVGSMSTKKPERGFRKIV